ncbi:hypothetical protein Tco_1013067 [Tanacetum coccineum]
MVVRLWCCGGDAVIMLEAVRVVTRWWRRWCGDCCGAPAVVAEGGGVGGGRMAGDGRNLASGGRRKMGERISMCGG